MIYQWKPEARVKLDPQVAGEELERIRTWGNGRLDPLNVVECSRDPGAPLHSHFEWDDGVAANEYRRDQAKYLIRMVTVVVNPETEDAKPIRAFVSVVRDEDRSYTSVSHALSEAELRQQVLMQALRDLEAWRSRYAGLVELAQVFAAIDEAQPAIKG